MLDIYFFQFIQKFGCLPGLTRVPGWAYRVMGAGVPGSINRRAGAQGSGGTGSETQKTFPDLQF